MRHALTWEGEDIYSASKLATDVFAEWSEKRDHEAKHGREVHHTVQYSTSRMRQFGHFTDAGGAAPGKLGSASGHTACVCAVAQLCDDWLLSSDRCPPV